MTTNNQQTQVFVPSIRKKNKDLWGQQIFQTSRFGLMTKGTVLYRQSDQLQKIGTAVDTYIKATGDQRVRLSKFKSVMEQRIVQGRQAVNQYTLNQIADFLPWVFSSQMLFEPFRSILFCVKNKIIVNNAALKKVSSEVSDETLNQSAIQAIYQSLKFKNSYIARARQLFALQSVGIFTRYFTADNQGTLLKTTLQGMGSVYVSAKQAAIDLWDFLKKGFASSTIESSKLIELKGSILDVFDQLFDSLRIYGSIIINFAYLKKVSSVRKINGVNYYYTINQPNVLISCQSSLPNVYTLNGNQLQRIPEILFNQQFLRKMVGIEVVKLGGQLLNELNTAPSRTEQQVKARGAFKTSYLNWSNTVRVKGQSSVKPKEDFTKHRFI